VAESSMTLALKGDPSGLVTASKAGEKAVDGLEKSVKGTGEAIDKKLVPAVKTGDKALDALDHAAKDTGLALGGLGHEAQTSGDDLTNFGRKAEQASQAATRLGRASQSIKTTGKVLAWGSSKIMNQYTGLAGGAGIGLATKQAMDFNHAMTMTAIGARDAAGKIDDTDMSSWLLKTTAAVKKVSEETGAPMGEIAAGIDQIKSKTGNIHQATTEMEMLTKAAIGTGASVSDIFGLASQLDAKVGIKGTEQMRQALTLLMEQGQSGSFELKDMVDNGERLFTAMAQYNKIGSKDPMENLRSFGALLQMGKNAAGGPAEATTAMERMGAFMSNVKKVEKQLGKTGIHVKLDPRASIETNLKTIIVKASKTKRDLALRALKSSDAFGEEGGRLMDALANEYAAGRGFQQMDSFKTAGGDLAKSTSLMSAFKEASSDAYGQANKLKALVVSWSHDMVGGAALSPLTDAMRWINEHGDLTKQVLTGMAASLVAMAVAVGGMKLATLVGEFNAIRGAGGKGKAGGLAGAAASMGGATPVYVVNLPGSALAGAAAKGGAAAEGAAAQAARRGLLSRMGGWVGSVTPTWIKRVGGTIRTAGKTITSGVGDFVERKGVASGAGRVLGYASKFGSGAVKAAGGSAVGAALSLPFELYGNKDKRRAVFAAAGTGVGGFLGGLVPVPGLDIATSIGGGMGGRKLAVTLYDLLTSGAADKRLSAAAAQTDTAARAGEAGRRAAGTAPFQPTFQIYNSVDAQGRTATRVEGPGALDVKVNSFGSLTAPWALGAH